MTDNTELIERLEKYEITMKDYIWTNLVEARAAMKDAIIALEYQSHEPSAEGTRQWAMEQDCPVTHGEAAGPIPPIGLRTNPEYDAEIYDTGWTTFTG